MYAAGLSGFGMERTRAAGGWRRRRRGGWEFRRMRLETRGRRLAVEEEYVEYGWN